MHTITSGIIKKTQKVTRSSEVNLSKPYLSLKEAVLLSLKESRQNFWSSYQIGKLIFFLYQKKDDRPFHLKIRKEIPAERDYRRVVKDLTENGTLEPVIDTGHTSIFRAFKSEAGFTAEAACIADPLGYISHRTAMEHHKLSHESSESIIWSTLSPKQWTSKIKSFMKEDLGEDYLPYCETHLPILSRPHLEQHGCTIYTGSNLGIPLVADYQRLRVASVGRTFLDMLRRPDLCGGMEAVLSIFKTEAADHLTDILKEIDRHGTKIEKVRAGYVLEECCGLEHEIISGWNSFAMRGGSRKLDPAADYAPRFSKRWMLSVNVENYKNYPHSTADKNQG